ncbi:hypothetical protein L6452_40572 [Arctium lappa]|uniref:Uncharacterized protein n=1 Tax=Arctium lappa TaxID=4217 RepID=A0ACB8XNG4_ARCLA|nr:hypothetical protein L6452_40572 [Arctium lappa]
MVSVSQPKLPIINMDDLKPESESWILRCHKVTHALEEYGCFMAVYEGVSKELNREVFDLVKTLFELPTETKIKNTSDTPVFGYLGATHTRPLFESMGIENVTSLDHVQHFANLMWPSRNHHFSENIHSYANLVSELENVVKKMVFQSYGVEKNYESYNKSSMTYLLRAWSNGRLRTVPHRVMMNGQENRYSIGLFTFKKGIIEIPEELVDEEHPSRFKPFNHLEFVDHMSKSPLYIDERAIKLFCGA